MPVPHRPRWLPAIALPALFAVLILAASASGQAPHPNSIFTNHTEFNRDIGFLFRLILWIGSAVFVFVEGLLIYAIIKFRRKSENDRPEHVHGNTTLEILWTAIPAVILAVIAVPTVKTIFKTQAVASADALQVQVIGHQWWWEFRYPQYTTTNGAKVDTLVTANELYIPLGRKVNFTLTTYDVIHSFWIPQLGGKRDLISNRVNHLWFTPDSVGENAWNGFCAEYCGTSHGNMHFKTFTVTPENFQAWTAHQLTAAVGTVAAAPAAPAAMAVAADTSKAKTVQNPSDAHVPGPATLAVVPTNTAAGVAKAAAAGSTNAAHDMSTMSMASNGYESYPREKIPAHVVPQTPLPAGLTFNESLKGDPARGATLITGVGTCLGCHSIRGNPMMVAQMGPNLTHVASRSTIAGGIYPNDAKHLAMWIKNASKMKPGVLMPTLGAGEWDEARKIYAPKPGLNDQQIADIVAYLQTLK